ncbi:hypothetical protein Patl1_24257 [Pistacia atlantica]|uniref:Uncharacterized protein n=1 Tax=Pistacia atlantica TaxID=434234 RepID=A0ACC0ZXP1_9ROSI|nr:hypothetical protein Patl1_24257 [Pistacia atlantica]
MTPVKSALVSGCLALVYSEFQVSRIDHLCPLPFILRTLSKSSDGPACSNRRHSSCSRICSQGSAKLVPNDVDRLQEDQKLKIGVVFDWALGDRWIQCDLKNFGQAEDRCSGRDSMSQ